MDDVLPHTVEREPVIVDEEGKIEIVKEDASGEEVKILEHEKKKNKEEPVLIDTDGKETKDEGEVGAGVHTTRYDPQHRLSRGD